jgi:hypothetical protein
VSGRAARLLSGSTAVLLLAGGCGGSSKSRSPGSAAPTAPQTTVGGSTPPAPATSGTVTGSSRGVTATLHAGTHHPKVGRGWPLRFTVTRAGHAARASLSYEYLFNGQVVAHRSHEGVAVSTLGAALGLLAGVIGGGLLVGALGVSAYVSPSVTAWGLGRGLLVGVAIGVLGGIYPAWRVTRMTPLKALSGT